MNRTSMRQLVCLVFLLVTRIAVAAGQNVTPLVAPADRILGLRADLALDSAQMLKLRELARDQNVALSRATSAFLHAEADLVDAGRSNDLGTRRTAIEKRSRAAIDGEMTRMRAERDARAVLTSAQLPLLDLLLTESSDPSTRSRPIWDSQVAPLPLNAVPFAPPDSGNIRISVVPLTTAIYVDDRNVGFGRVAVRLALGAHTIKFRAPGCTDARVIVVAKGPLPVVSHTMTCK